MENGSVRPIPDRPALELIGAEGPTVVLADLHLGLGSNEGPTSVPPSALARSMAQDLIAIAEERRARGFLVVGDVKHPIVGTPPALRPVVFDFFSTLLSNGYRAAVVLGNHVVGLTRWLPKEVRVHPATGLRLGATGFFHGHRWPSDRVLGAERLVVGHLHPGFRFAPVAETPVGKARCWVRVERPAPETRPRRPRAHPPVAAREVIVLPAFNPLAGTESLNRERPARGRSFLVRRFLSPGSARAYTLDGTDVGPVLTRVPAALRPPGARRSRAGR